MTTLEKTSPEFPKLPLPTLLRRLHIANDIFTKKHVPYKHLSEKYAVSERTIKSDVHWIRSNFNIELIQKAVQDKVAIALEEVVNPIIILKYGLPFLSKGLTQKVEMEEKIKVEEKHVSIVADYTRAIEAAVNADIKALRARKQVDTPQTNT